MDDSTRYKEYLQVIFNTRLLCNSREGLAVYIGHKSLKENGFHKIKSPFQMKAIYSELAKEYYDLTDGYMSLDEIMEAYPDVSRFYTEKLSKFLSKNFEENLFEFLDACYGKDVDEEYVNGPMLLLFALNILPTYNARSKDIDDFPVLASRLKDFLSRYVDRNPLLANAPLINMLFDRMEDSETEKLVSLPCRSRAYLIFISRYVLNRFHVCNNPQALLRLTGEIADSGGQVDIEGYWIETDGTEFWKIEAVAGKNTFFLYHWHFSLYDRCASYTRYSMQLMQDNTVSMLVAPWATARIAAKDMPVDKPLSAWYGFYADDDMRHIALNPTFRSADFPQKLLLEKITDGTTIGLFDKIVNDFTVTDNFAKYHYEFRITLTAITGNDLYVRFPGGFFKIPFYRNPEFANVSMDEDIGYMTVGNRLYIASNGRNVYIDATDPEQLKRDRGITVVERVIVE